MHTIAARLNARNDQRVFLRALHWLGHKGLRGGKLLERLQHNLNVDLALPRGVRRSTLGWRGLVAETTLAGFEFFADGDSHRCVGDEVDRGGLAGSSLHRKI